MSFAAHSNLSKVPPQSLQCGNSCDGGSFGAHYACPQPNRDISTMQCGSAFCLGKSAFRTDQQHGLALGFGLIMQRSTAPRQQNKFCICYRLGLLQPHHDIQRCVYSRQHIPPALFASRDRNLLPVLEPLLHPFSREFRHATVGNERLDFIDAQLCGFLDYPIHFFAAGKSLSQHHMQR